MRSRITHPNQLISKSLANLHLSDDPIITTRYCNTDAGLTKAELARRDDQVLQRRLKAGLRTKRRPQQANG